MVANEPIDRLNDLVLHDVSHLRDGYAEDPANADDPRVCGFPLGFLEAMGKAAYLERYTGQTMAQHLWSCTYLKRLQRTLPREGKRGIVLALPKINTLFRVLVGGDTHHTAAPWLKASFFDGVLAPDPAARIGIDQVYGTPSLLSYCAGTHTVNNGAWWLPFGYKSFRVCAYMCVNLHFKYMYFQTQALIPSPLYPYTPIRIHTFLLNYTLIPPSAYTQTYTHPYPVTHIAALSPSYSRTLAPRPLYCRLGLLGVHPVGHLQTPGRVLPQGLGLDETRAVVARPQVRRGHGTRPQQLHGQSLGK